MSKQNDKPSVPTSKLHINLQAKGGAGKSYVASIVAQYLRSKGKELLCFDIDPGNQTFSAYPAIGAKFVNIMDDDAISPRAFDPIIESLATSELDAVIDCGSSTFIPLSAYLTQNSIPQLLNQYGRSMVYHVVIAGGSNLADTMAGFLRTAERAADMSIIVWVNEFFGDVMHKDVHFVDSPAFKSNAHKVAGVVRMPRYEASTFGTDVMEMCRARLTFDEAQNTKELGLVVRQRLLNVKRDFFNQLDTIGL